MAVVSQNIKRLREARDWTQDDLATKSGVPQPRISKYERGTTPGVHTLLKVASGLGVGLDEIVRGQHPAYDAAVDLSRQVGRLERHQGGAVDPATARALREREDKQHRLLKEARKLALTLINALEGDVDDAAVAESRAAPTATTKGRRRHRKTS